jgi:hypothetical protein
VTPEARAARERKQKIFVVVGGLLLLALLAFQLPRLLGGSSGPEAATTTDTTAVAGATATATPAATPVSLAGTTPTSASTTKLTSFSVFASKDPFVQQVVTENGLGASDGGGTTSATSGKTTETAKTPSKTFSTGKTTTASVTIVTVNGARQILAPGAKFPASDPLFVLVAENPGSKSIVVGIVGGAYSGGGKTTTLKVGKPLTLVNTTTGARYKISLVSVGSGDQAGQAAPTPTP